MQIIMMIMVFIVLHVWDTRISSQTPGDGSKLTSEVELGGRTIVSPLQCESRRSIIVYDNYGYA
jgi:hypothetical protein